MMQPTNLTAFIAKAELQPSEAIYLMEHCRFEQFYDFIYYMHILSLYRIARSDNYNYFRIKPIS